MRRLLVLALILCCVAFAPLRSAYMQAVYSGLDVVFLIDQSGSMGGRAFSSTPSNQRNDPDGIRFQATQFGIDWLGSFRAQQSLFGGAPDISASVIYFGDDAEVQLPLVSLNPSNLDDWQTQRLSLIEPLSETAFTGRNLGNTDFIAAFEAALEVLPQSRERLQAIILLTDGAPCAPERPNFSNNCDVVGEWTAHLRELSGDIQRRFNRENQFIYAVALVPENTWTYVSPNWNNITENGFARRLERPTQFGVVFNEILTDLASQVIAGEADDRAQLGINVSLPQLTASQSAIDARNGSREYEVPPYQQLMSISLFKSRADAELVLLDPFNDPITSKTPGVTVFGEGTLIEIWQIANPIPGPWQIGTRYEDGGRELSDGYAYASVDLLRARFDLKVPDGFAPMLLPVTLALEALDAQDQVLPLYPPQHQLRGSITVVPPEGESFTLPLAMDGNASRYTAHFTPSLPGQYTISTDVNAGEARFLAEETLDVSETRALIEGVQPSILERTDQTYTLRFVNPTGREVEGIEVETFEIIMLPPEASCAQPGERAERLPLPVEQNGRLTINARHQTTGDGQRMCVRVVVRDEAPADGQSLRQVLNQEYARVQVRPVQPVGFRLVRPQELALDEVKPLLLTTYVSLIPGIEAIVQNPEWQVEPIEVGVEVLDKESESPLRNVQADIDPYNFFTVQVLDANDRNLIGADAHLIPTDNPSRWAITIDPLPPGNYTLVIQAVPGALGQTDRAVLTDDSVIRLPMTIIENTAARAEQGVIAGAAGAALLGLVWFGGARPVLARVNPVKGTLFFVRRVPDGRLYKVMRNPLDFRDNRFNHIKVPLRDLPVVRPPLTSMLLRTRRGVPYMEVGVNGVLKTKVIQSDEPIPLDFMDSEGNQYFVVYNRYIHDGQRWEDHSMSEVDL